MLVREGEPLLPVGRVRLDEVERLRDELLDLLIPVHEEREGRGLDPTGREEALSALPRDDGQEAREEGAPDEVDLLAGLGGLGEGVVERCEMGKTLLDLLPRQGAVARPLHLDVRMDLLKELERLGADELALAVEVRRDDHPIELADDLLECPDDAGLGDPLERLGLEQLAERLEIPIRELGRVVGLDDVSAQTDDGVLSVGPLEPEDVRPPSAEPLHPPVRQDDGDPQRGVELLSDDQRSHEPLALELRTEVTG